MDYVRLGRTGMQVSRICLGCMSYGQAKTPGLLEWPWALSEEEGRPYIKRAIEAGINFFDTANVYSNGASEEVLGRALRDFANRDEIVLATKVWGPVRRGPNGRGLSRKHIFSEIDKSLRRLGTDYVDLYIIHRYDYDTPLEEGGTNLSGGQQQRLSIARALLCQPRILIFDEATSALDPESEAAIQENLARIAEGRTVIIVSHRLSSLVGADAIVVLERGGVVDYGRHGDLLSRCTTYRQLWGQQHRHLAR